MSSQVADGAKPLAERRAAERRRAVAVHADRRLRVPVGLPHRRAGRARRRRSTGCACRASTRRACSARCSTAGPACSGSGRSASTSRRRAHYEPGTNVLVTTWKTPTGWIEVRDALTMGPRRRVDTITPHTRPPADDDAEHLLVRTVALPRGQRRGRARLRARCSTTAARRPSGRSSDDLHTRGRDGRRPDDPAADRHGARRRGQPRARPARPARGRASCSARCRGPRGSSRRPTSTTPTRGSTATTHFWRAWLGRARFPDHRWRDPIQRSALAIKGLTYMPTGRDGRRAHHVAARDPGRRAQLGLPLHVDARLDVHAAGAALAQPRLGGRRVHAVRRRHRAQRRRRAADHVRDRRPPRPDRVHARRPLRLRRRAPGADRQRRVRPAPERRLRRGARLDPAAHAPQPAAAAAAVADRADAGRVRHARLARARPGHLGGARRAAALRVLQADVLGRARPRRQAGRDPRRPGAAGASGRRPAEEIRADILEHGVDARGVLRQHYATDALDASTLLAAIFGFLPARRRAAARERARDRATS